MGGVLTGLGVRDREPGHLLSMVGDLSGVGWAKGLSPCPSPESDQARLNPDLELGRSWLRSLWAGGDMDEAVGETTLPGPYRVLSGFELEGWMLEQKLSMGGNLDTEDS